MLIISAMKELLIHFTGGKTEARRGQVTCIMIGPAQKTLSPNISPTTIVPQRFPLPKPMQVAVACKRTTVLFI